MVCPVKTERDRWEWFKSTEGKILVIGSMMFAAFMIVMFGSLLIDADYYKAITGVSVGHLFFGRAAGLSVGFAFGLSSVTVVLMNFIIEVIMVLVIYPLFILSWNQLLNIGKFKAWMESTRANAQKYHDKIERYGMIGLFVFVWFPFWMTGPVVGAIIGYIMGLRHRVTLSIVLAGTLLATICWALFISYIQEWARSIDPMAPWYIVGVIAFIVFTAYVVRRVRRNK